MYKNVAEVETWINDRDLAMNFDKTIYKLFTNRPINKNPPK